MPKISCKVMAWLTWLAVLCLTGPAWGWHDKTHLAISQAAGYENWYNTAGPDVTKTKARDLEEKNHWCNNRDVTEVTAAMVWDQVKRYNRLEDKEGHLYGAIIGALRDYQKAKASDKYAEYHLAFCAHYIGDLSMPLHNVPYGEDKFNNPNRHSKYDGVVEYSVLNNIGLIQRNMYEITIESPADLAVEIARIANISRQLAARLENQQRELTQEEAYKQLYHSASLLKAVLAYAKRTKY